MTTVSSGIVVYPAGGESASYVIPIPSGAVAGDVLMVKIDTAAGTVVMNAAPAGVTTLIAQSQNPGANHRDCGLHGYTIPSSPPASVTFTFPSAVRGNAVWWLVRGVTLTDVQNSVSAWASNTTTVTAPTITGVPAGASVYGGLSYGSGSAVVNPPASPWALLQDGNERRGYVASKGVQASAGATGTAVFGVPAATNTGRAWQLALPEAGEPPVPPLVAALMSQPPAGATGDVADGASIMPVSVASGGPFVFTTDKAAGGGGGLYTLGIDGQIDQSFTGLAANSVDWRDMTGITGWGDQVILLTTDRDTNKLIYAWVNRATGALTAAGTTTLAYEPYGTCLYLHSDGNLYAFVADRGAGDTGTHNVRQYLLTPSGTTVSAGAVVRTITETGVMEGMAADDGRAQIYISREDYGLYRYSAAPTGPTTATTVDTVGAGNLVADVEDVAFVKRAEGDKLIVSSQGDNSYHVYDVVTLAHEQRFTLVEPDGVTPVTGTDGLDALAVPLGAGFPNGLLVVHTSTPNPSRFAFVDLAEVLGATAIIGTLTVTLPKLQGALAGQSVNVGSLAGRLPRVAGVLAGVSVNRGTLNATVTKVTATLTGGSVNPGSLDASVPRVAASLQGMLTNLGALHAAVLKVTASLTGQSVNPGAVDAALPVVTGALEGESLNQGVVDAVLPLVTAQIADVDTNRGTLNATLPRVTGELTGASTNTGTLDAVTPTVTAVLTGTVTNQGELEATLPRVLAQLGDTTSNAGTLVARLPVMSAELVGESVNRGTLNASAPKVTAAIVGEIVNVGTLTATAPLVTGALVGSLVNIGVLAAILPRLIMTKHVLPPIPAARVLTGTRTARALALAGITRTLTGHAPTRRLEGKP